MRFLCFVGILFFLTLKHSEGATQASCTTEIEQGVQPKPTYLIDTWYWLDPRQKLKICNLFIETVDEEDFTISSDKDWKFLVLEFLVLHTISFADRSTVGLRIEYSEGVKFLPTNVFDVFPDLIAFEVRYCSITTVNRNHFKNLSKLEYLVLYRNEIDQVAKDAFVDLVSLEFLGLAGNRIQSLSTNTFSSLKALKDLNLCGNKIQHLDPEIFKSLVKIEGINLDGNIIATLDVKIFASLTNLKGISLAHNKLKEIPGNLFHNNLKLEFISLDRNEINFIDPNMFDHLPDLDEVRLTRNLCVNETYSKGSFDAMRSDLKQTCKTL